MNDKPFDPTKPCTTRSGHPARIVCTDMKATQPIVAIVALDNSREISSQFTSGGRYYEDPDRESTLDLINVPVKRKGWIAVLPYKEGDFGSVIAWASNVYTSPENLRNGVPSWQSRKIIEIEFEECTPKPRYWDETTDDESTRWVCVECGSALHADCVGDECPVCGARRPGSPMCCGG